MKMRFSREDALLALQPLQGLLGSRSLLPVLSHVLIEAGPDSCRVIGSDLELWISCRFPAQVEESGNVTIPGRRFFSIVREAPETQIALEGSDGSSKLSSGRSFFKLLGVPCSEFPAGPRLGDVPVIRIPQAVLKRVFRQTVYAVSQDQNRYILNGLYVCFREGRLTVAATDGKRLAIAENPVELPADFDREMVLTVKSVNELQRILGDSGEVEVRVGDKQVSFETPDLLLISRLIDGRYPDFRQVIPKETRERIVLPREEFIQVLRRGSLLSSEKSNSVRFDFAGGTLTVSSVTPEVGESREEMELDYRGTGLEIAFNPAYLLEVLRALEGKTDAVLELIDENSPGIFRDENFFCLIMPMKLN